MIPLTVNISGVKQEVYFPTSWKEVTMGQLSGLLQLGEKGIDRRPPLLEVFTGIPAETWEDSPARVGAQAWHFLQPLYTQPMPEWDKLPVPKSIEINGKEVTIPKDFGEEVAYGAIESMRAFLLNKNPAYYYHIVVAFTLCERIVSSGKYREPEAELLAWDIINLPAYLIFPLGAFFLTQLYVYQKTHNLSSKYPGIRLKLPRELRNSKNLVRFSLSAILPKKTGRKQTFT